MQEASYEFAWRFACLNVLVRMSTLLVCTREVSMELSLADKRELLVIARASIGSALNDSPLPQRPHVEKQLREPAGAFVTLHLHGELRGCIGYIEPRFPLHKTIEEAAQKAAFEDPRFLPLSSKELDEIEIEISVLSPLRKISDINEIEVGKHGLVVDAGYTRGLLLPQVATEYGWKRDQFLSHTCRKAGLPADAWKGKGVTISIFSSDVFSEAEILGRRN
jgi:AmmeMemoRadiSam system protein A